MDLSEVSKALYKHLMTDENDFKSVMTGGLHFIENTKDPDEVVYPYAVYEYLPGESDYDSADKWDRPILVVTIYEDGEKDPLVILGHGKKLYDRLIDSEASLVMESQTMLSVDKINTPFADRTLEEDWFLEYRFRLWVEE